VASVTDIVILDITQDDIDAAWQHRENRQKDQPLYSSCNNCAAARAAERVFQPREGARLAVTPNNIYSERLILASNTDGELDKFVSAFDSWPPQYDRLPKPTKIQLSLLEPGKLRLRKET